MLPIEHDFLMIQPKPLSTNYSHLVAVKKTSTSQQTLEKIAKFTFRFAFINLGQWILLLLSNFICASFMIFILILIR